jgi:hypothetical protein
MSDQKLTYLSIDLDYWKVFPELFINKIVQLNVPTAVAIEHHHLLPHVNQFKECTRLVNIDQHADLCGNLPDDEEVCDGTWGCRVNWRHKDESTFIWSYPHASSVKGRTNIDSLGWCDNEASDNPFFSRNPSDLCDWSYVSRRRLPLLTRKELNSVVAVGISISPLFLKDKDVVSWSKIIFELAKKHGFKNYNPKWKWNKTIEDAKARAAYA